MSTAQKEILGLHRITKKHLKQLCKKDRLYQTPALNDVLYLHYQGFQAIESLEEYTELKCLWLESNAISEISGLENQTKLKCLFLQNNLVKRIENLEHCSELDTLNLSSNHIRKIENCGVDVLPVLSSLNLAGNYLCGSDCLRELVNCTYLTVLDLSNNRINDILCVKIFSKMPKLRVLVLQGNPVVSKIPQYRKTLILECKELTYLDSRPVFPRDRACAEAWKRGGYEEERKEHDRWNREERRKIRESVNATLRLRNKHAGGDNQIELIRTSDEEDTTTKEKSNSGTKLSGGGDVSESKSETKIAKTVKKDRSEVDGDSSLESLDNRTQSEESSSDETENKTDDDDEDRKDGVIPVPTCNVDGAETESTETRRKDDSEGSDCIKVPEPDGGASPKWVKLKINAISSDGLHEDPIKESTDVASEPPVLSELQENLLELKETSNSADELLGLMRSITSKTDLTENAEMTKIEDEMVEISTPIEYEKFEETISFHDFERQKIVIEDVMEFVQRTEIIVETQYELENPQTVEVVVDEKGISCCEVVEIESGNLHKELELKSNEEVEVIAKDDDGTPQIVESSEISDPYKFQLDNVTYHPGPISTFQPPKLIELQKTVREIKAMNDEQTKTSSMVDEDDDDGDGEESDDDDLKIKSEEDQPPQKSLTEVLNSFKEFYDALPEKRRIAKETKLFPPKFKSVSAAIGEMAMTKPERKPEIIQEMVDRVYAQKEKYDDDLELVDGRLMVVKKGTGVLEELPAYNSPVCSYRSISDNSEDYATPLSDDDDDDGETIEQHNSDTRITRGNWQKSNDTAQQYVSDSIIQFGQTRSLTFSSSSSFDDDDDEEEEEEADDVDEEGPVPCHAVAAAADDYEDDDDDDDDDDDGNEEYHSDRETMEQNNAIIESEDDDDDDDWVRKQRKAKIDASQEFFRKLQQPLPDIQDIEQMDDLENYDQWQLAAAAAATEIPPECQPKHINPHAVLMTQNYFPSKNEMKLEAPSQEELSNEIYGDALSDDSSDDECNPSCSIEPQKGQNDSFVLYQMGAHNARGGGGVGGGDIMKTTKMTSAAAAITSSDNSEVILIPKKSDSLAFSTLDPIAECDTEILTDYED